ncbi:thiamine pyrophosphate-binding protein [Nocardia seriolae]|uniref:acetolactate synthase n=1 Tax=Nocardia seriolae TaxID=37332 RepID=A0ABC8ALD1_9NOCA|nr:thiamine pyrophosphate-binding protein [Nocardia seriolae]APA95073.1 Pyruvate dehydrogenase (quinone) [Nocardia seriolae]OJF83270.1 acetolactate synthase [Nocardia seriolae]QOW32024.1 thiamine pyrophosphate-binding protein [Nocardia seriolae]WNJ59103.1 thiamine pyrophosphate-binding protein [Nocardia seriolae]BEK99363.1 thiamine pyrophosphate-binding protein [Nocardia seriolae]
MHSGTRVADHLVKAVSALGVGHIFGVGGANIEDLYDAAFEHRKLITAVVAKHEFAAATMADGYARSTSGIGVVCATSGGGAVNLVAGLAEAFASRVPVLALVGQPPTVLEGKGAFQDSSGQAGAFDAVALFTPISRYCARVEAPADLPAHLTHAVTAARRGGPAVLLLPKDIQQADLVAPDFVPPSHAYRREIESLWRVLDIVRGARATGKLVIIAGDQVARDNARAELARFAAALDAAVGVAPDAKDVYHHADPGYCGVSGSMGNPELLDALHGAALCLLIGTRMPVTARAGMEEALAAVPTVSIGALQPFLPTRHAGSNDLAKTLAELIGELDSGAADSAPVIPLHPRVEPGHSLTPLPVPPSDGPGLRYREVVETINDALPPGSDVFADAGNTGAAVVHHLRLPRDGRFTVALGMGGMGYAFGAGIGSAFARHRRPDGSLRRTYVIAGDGAFFMHGMEIHTAIEHRLPVTFVVLNNNAHAMCITREQLYYGDRYSFNRFRPAYPGAGMAAMFPDLCTHAPESPAELAAALRHCADRPGPTFIAVDCDPDEIPPFTPFLTPPRR